MWVVHTRRAAALCMFNRRLSQSLLGLGICMDFYWLNRIWNFNSTFRSLRFHYIHSRFIQCVDLIYHLEIELSYRVSAANWIGDIILFSFTFYVHATPLQRMLRPAQIEINLCFPFTVIRCVDLGSNRPHHVGSRLAAAGITFTLRKWTARHHNHRRWIQNAVIPCGCIAPATDFNQSINCNTRAKYQRLKWIRVWHRRVNVHPKIHKQGESIAVPFPKFQWIIADGLMLT